MKNLIKDFKAWRKERKEQMEFRTKLNQLIVADKLNPAAIRDIINECQRSPDVTVEMYMLDGTHLVFRYNPFDNVHNSTSEFYKSINEEI